MANVNYTEVLVSFMLISVLWDVAGFLLRVPNRVWKRAPRLIVVASHLLNGAMAVLLLAVPTGHAWVLASSVAAGAVRAVFSGILICHTGPYAIWRALPAVAGTLTAIVGLLLLMGRTG